MTLERQLTNGKVRDLLAATKKSKNPKKIKNTKNKKNQIHYKTVLVNVYVRKANGL
tara:strand:- start:348 stop:515 length:168 start_codon:yes stop_codon:yes gene_type:complete